MLLCNIIKQIYLSTPEHGVIQEPFPQCQGIAQPCYYLASSFCYVSRLFLSDVDWFDSHKRACKQMITLCISCRGMETACSIIRLDAAWGVCGNWAKGTFLVLYKSLVLGMVLSSWRKHDSKNHTGLSLIRIWFF